MKKFVAIIALAISASACQPAISEHAGLDYPALAALKNIKGVDPENFYFGPCVYLHGEDGSIREWDNFDDEKLRKLQTLFMGVPLTKLDYSSNPNNVSDEVMVGPLCNCIQYKSSAEQIAELGLEFSSKLAHGTEGLASCVDFSEFR